MDSHNQGLKLQPFFTEVVCLLPPDFLRIPLTPRLGLALKPEGEEEDQEEECEALCLTCQSA